MNCGPSLIGEAYILAAQGPITTRSSNRQHADVLRPGERSTDLCSWLDLAPTLRFAGDIQSVGIELSKALYRQFERKIQDTFWGDLQNFGNRLNLASDQLVQRYRNSLGHLLLQL